jgi:hypothetical protein
MVHGSNGASSAGKSGRKMKSWGARAVLFARLAMVAVGDVTIASVVCLVGWSPVLEAPHLSSVLCMLPEVNGYRARGSRRMTLRVKLFE